MANQQDMMRQILAKTIASAWIDTEYKSRLLANPRSILSENGLSPPPHLEIVAVENTALKVHIALPAPWADTSNPAFMQRLQTQPKAVLLEVGIHVAEQAEVVFLENTANKMHIILPVAPGYEEISVEQI